MVVIVDKTIRLVWHPHPLRGIEARVRHRKFKVLTIEWELEQVRDELQLAPIAKTTYKRHRAVRHDWITGTIAYSDGP